MPADTENTIKDWRRREVQAMGAAISKRDWHEAEVSYASLRDKMDTWIIIAARDGIEAQHGLNDTFPGDPVKVRADSLGGSNDR